MTDLVPRGSLLVANPAVYEPNFHRTLVLVIEHNDEGAIGVVLNRASETSLGEILPAWRHVASPPEVLFVGGPVTPEAVIGVARGMAGEGADGWSPFWGELATVDLSHDPFDLGVAIDAVRVFTGYSGWEPGQLEGELDHGLWIVVDGTAGDVFTSDPEGLWRRVLGRQRGQRAWLANFPPEPSLN